MKTFTVHLPLNDEQLQAVGKVAAMWSFAQLALEQTIWALMMVPEDIGRRATTEVNDMTRINVAKSLAELRMTEESYKAFSGALNEYNELRTKRNEVIHNLWAGSDKRDLLMGYKPTAKGPYRVGRNFWSVADLNALADDIEHWGGECFAALHGMILEERPEEQPTSPPAR